MISHEIVLQKLVKYGLNQNSVSSFTSYLSSRNQQCSVNSHLSADSQINCGITQGSLIGPLLFLLYINDLPSSLDNGTAPMNADGTSIRFAAPTIYDDLEMMINTELANINTWLKVNNHSSMLLKLNSWPLAPVRGYKPKPRIPSKHVSRASRSKTCVGYLMFESFQFYPYDSANSQTFAHRFLWIFLQLCHAWGS